MIIAATGSVDLPNAGEVGKLCAGAQLEHAARNAQLIISLLWSELKDPERWQIGQAYAVEFSEGNKEAVKGLHSVLLSVRGFDFVPENLHSTTFIEVASKVLAAHQGLNNFYNEPAPMHELAKLETSIPGPALAACVTAMLCIKLGNSYGISWAAQPPADEVAKSLSKDRRIYYLNGRLSDDWIILAKLAQQLLANRRIDLLRPLKIDPVDLTKKEIRSLLDATNVGDKIKVTGIAQKLFNTSLASN